MIINRILCPLCVCIVCLATAALAHDTWIQTNATIVRVGDTCHADLFLGNHGNDHRDFKIAGKASLDHATWDVTDPDGKIYDLKPQASDQGYAPKEGFWTSSFTADKAGIYVVAQTSDQVVTYAPLRSIHSAKTFVLAAKSLDKPPVNAAGFDRVLGHPLELVPTTNPVAPMGPGTALTVRALFKGKPAADLKISFIPRGTTLRDGFDERYECRTNDKGTATFEPKAANYYLVVAHREAPDEKGPGFDATKYSATLLVYVPGICPCCGN